MTPTSRSRLARCGRFAALGAAIVLTGCAAQRGRQETREMYASTDLAAYYARAPTPAGPLTLGDALEYAGRYNIEVWIAAQEREFQHELATQSLLKMLPALVWGGQSSRRSEYDASSSEGLDSGAESLETSYSSEKRIDTWDVSATWNLLDFGISFLRARQQANRVSIAQERERRVRQNLALGVTRAWWQAVTAREIAAQAQRAGQDIAAMLEKTGREIDEQTVSLVEGLKRETGLLEQQEELRRYRRSFLTAKTELATLVGLPPDASFTLAEVDLDRPVAPLTFEIEELEWEALRSRPELFEKDLEEAISRDAARVALAQMFPSVSLFWRYDHDNNRFLAFQQWNAAGIRASWDLLAIPQQIKQRQAVQLQTELVARRRTAVAVAVLTQLHLSLIDHDEAAERLDVTRSIAERRQRLLLAIQDAVDEGKSHGGESLDHRLKYLKARGRYLAAYANLMVSRARVLNTVGRAPQCQVQNMTDEELLRQMVRDLERRLARPESAGS